MGESTPAGGRARSGVTDDHRAAWGTWQTWGNRMMWAAVGFFQDPRSAFLPLGPVPQATVRSKGSLRDPFIPKGACKTEGTCLSFFLIILKIHIT